VSQKKPIRIAVFIDWQNMGDHKHVIDTKRLREYIDTLGAARRCFIYVVDFRHPAAESSLQPSSFIENLKVQGYTVRYKVLPLFRDLRRRADGNLDVDMTIDVMKTLFDRSITIDKVVLFSGDSDFCPLLREIKKWRTKDPIRTLVIGRDGHTSSKLARLADEFLYIETILSQICTLEILPIAQKLRVVAGKPFD
jgi:uncharacterized LabA/DUF88 family protein